MLAAVVLMHQHTYLDNLLVRAHLRGSLSAQIVSIATAAIVVLGCLSFAGMLFHAFAWGHAAQQERWLSDDGRSMAVPPLAAHLAILPERVGLLFSVIISVLGVGLLAAYAAVASHPGPLGGLGALLSIVGAVSFADARRERRAIALSNAGSADSEPLPATPAPTEPAPPLHFVIFEAAETDRTSEYPLSESGNVFGRPPWNIVYLRVFANERRLSSVLSSPWREFGYVHYIRAAASVTSAEIERARDGGGVFLASATEFEAEFARLARQTALVGTPDGRRFGASLQQRRKLIFRERALLCRTAFWQHALDLLLARTDLALLDLSGYQHENVGTAYELQRIIDIFPISRCAVMLDERSDVLFLEAQITHAWRQMRLSSPNREVKRGAVLLLVIPAQSEPRPNRSRGRRASRRHEKFTDRQLLQSRGQFLQLGRHIQDRLDTFR